MLDLSPQSPGVTAELADGPSELRAVARLVLASRRPQCLCWGPELRLLYNEACRAVLGDAHPAALGAPAKAGWAALWQLAGPRLEAAMRRGEAASPGTLRVLVERQGEACEAHYDVSLTPVAAEGASCGVLVGLDEATEAVVGEREWALLARLAARVPAAADLEAACRAAAEALTLDAADFPFAAMYLVDAAQREARLAGAAGFGPGHFAMPVTIALAEPSPWPLLQALDGGEQRVALAPARLGELPAGPWERPPREALVVALTPAVQARRAVLVVGLNPYRPLRGAFRRFVDGVVAYLGGALAPAQVADDEARHFESETLQEVARDLASELELHPLLQKVTDAATRLTGAQMGAFFLAGADGEEPVIELYTLSGAPREAFEPLGAPRRTPLFRPTLLGAGPVRCDDVTRDPRYGRLGPHHGTPAAHPPVRSYLAVPVVSRTGEVVGGLFFGHARPGVFDQRAERSALGIAAHAAVAIDNARLYGQAREELRRRVGMEAELRESERRHRDLVHNLPAAVYTTDAEGRIQLFNAAARELWGREPQAGRDRWCGCHRVLSATGEEVPREAFPVAQVLRGLAVPASIELVLERPDGTLRHVLAHPRAIRDGAGRMVGGLDMLVDISQRKAAEAEHAFVKDELARQIQSLTQLHDLSMRLGGIAALEPALQAILDTAVEAQGAAFGLISLHDARSGALHVAASRGFDPEFLAAVARVLPGPGNGACAAAFASGERCIVEDAADSRCFENAPHVVRMGGFRAVHSAPIVTRDGVMLGVLSVQFREPRRLLQRELQIADVCARHAADAIEAHRGQQALRESERLYRAIGESIDYGVWLADAQGRNTYTSECFLRLLGVPRERWAGFGWRDVVHPDDMPALCDRWLECVRTGQPLDHEFRVRCADGTYRTILGRGVPVRDEAGAIVSWAGINLDIERLKHVENELRELDQRKNEFLATLAHELRNPLAPLRNGLEVMRLSGANPAMVERARVMMERQLGQMVRLVDDLLDVSRVSRGKVELRREPMELAAALRNAVETSQPLMGERRHELTVRMPDEPVLVHGDMTRLSQVFSNLLNNAAKYTEPGGRVEAALEVVDGEARVTVRDNGIGIPPEMQGRVFDIFTQVDRSLEKSQGGLGIGLSIAKRLVEMHGGRISVRSTGHRQGSEFTVRLPVLARQRPVPAGPEGPAPAVRARRILVADDNPDSAQTLCIMLEVLGHQVRTANDGEEAVALAASFRPDFALLDIGMPRMNGYDACARIRAQPGGDSMFLVALTGWGQEEDKHRSRAAGFDRHLVKPVEPLTLQRLLEALPVDRAEASTR